MKKKLVTIVGCIAGAALFYWYVSTLKQHLSLDAIKMYRDSFLAYSQEYPTYSRFIYCATYFALITSFFPAGAIFNLLGGFLFGTIHGTVLALIAATLGALLNLFTIRYLIGKTVQKKYKDRLRTFNAAFKRNGVSYLLFVRLIAIFPFPISNTLLGLTNVSFFTYTWTTIIGIIPGVTLFVFMGKQLGTIKSIAEILTWPILMSFILLALLALAPVLLEKRSVAD